MKTNRIVIMSVIIAAMLSACSLFPGQQATPTAVPVVSSAANNPAEVVVEGRVVPRDYANMLFASPGTVGAVLVSEGQEVTRGTVLIELDNRSQVEAALQTAELEQLNAQQALDKLQRTAGLTRAQAEKALLDAQRSAVEARQKLDDLDTAAYRQQIDDAKVRMDNAKEDLDDAQEEYDKYKDLDEDNQTRKNAETTLEDVQLRYDQAVREYDRLVNDLDQARAAVALAESNQAEAQRTLDRRASGPDSDDLTLAEARLKNAEAQVKAAQEALDNLQITAPYDGRVVQINVSAGEPALMSQTVLVLADLETFYVETTDLTEIDVVDLAVGDEVTVEADALSDVSMTALVESISDTYREKGGDIIYTARLKLVDPDERLRWGMTVSVRFER